MNRKSMIVCFKMVCMASCEGGCLQRHHEKEIVNNEDEDRGCH